MAELYIGEIDYTSLVFALQKHGRVYIDLCCGNGTLFPTYLSLHDRAHGNGFCDPVVDLRAAFLPGHDAVDAVLVMAIGGWGCHTFALDRFSIVTEQEYIASHLHHAYKLPDSDALALAYFVSRVSAAWRGISPEGNADWRGYFGSSVIRGIWQRTFDHIPADLTALWAMIHGEEEND